VCDNTEIITALLSTHIKLLLTTFNENILSQNIMLCEILHDIYYVSDLKLL